MAELLPGPLPNRISSTDSDSAPIERQIAERPESRGAEFDERQAAHQRDSGNGRFRVAHEQQAVAQRIGAAEEHGEADAGEQVRRGQQPAVASRRRRSRQTSATA